MNVLFFNVAIPILIQWCTICFELCKEGIFLGRIVEK